MLLKPLLFSYLLVKVWQVSKRKHLQTKIKTLRFENVENVTCQLV